jgi:hypothetical protein
MCTNRNDNRLQESLSFENPEKKKTSGNSKAIKKKSSQRTKKVQPINQTQVYVQIGTTTDWKKHIYL